MSPKDYAFCIQVLQENLEASRTHLKALLALPTDDEQAEVVGDIIEGLTISITKANLALASVGKAFV